MSEVNCLLPSGIDRLLKLRVPSSKSAASTGRPPLPAAGGQGLCVAFLPEGENTTVVSCLFASGGSVWTHPLYLRLLPSNSHSALLCVARAVASAALSPVLSSPLLRSRSFTLRSALVFAVLHEK